MKKLLKRHAMKKNKELPFIMQDIQAIKWVPGDAACVVTYVANRDTETEKVHVKKASILQMELLQPEFRRFYACAAALHHNKTKPARNIAYEIRRWHQQLLKKDSRDFMLKRQHPWAWDGLGNLELDARQQSSEHPYLQSHAFGGLRAKRIANPYIQNPQPFLRLSWANCASAYFEYDLVEANCPGFIDWCTILCQENNVSGVAAFEARREFVKDLPYGELVAKKAAFTNNLRMAMAMGATVGEAVSLLRAGIAIAGTDAPVNLPEITTEMVI